MTVFTVTYIETNYQDPCFGILGPFTKIEKAYQAVNDWVNEHITENSEDGVKDTRTLSEWSNSNTASFGDDECGDYWDIKIHESELEID